MNEPEQKVEHTPVDPQEPAPQPTDNSVRKSDGVQDIDQSPRDHS